MLTRSSLSLMAFLTSAAFLAVFPLIVLLSVAAPVQAQSGNCHPVRAGQWMRMPNHSYINGRFQAYSDPSCSTPSGVVNSPGNGWVHTNAGLAAAAEMCNRFAPGSSVRRESWSANPNLYRCVGDGSGWSRDNAGQQGQSSSRNISVGAKGMCRAAVPGLSQAPKI